MTRRQRSAYIISVVSMFMFGAAFFVYDTLPKPYSSAPSHLYVDVLPMANWGVGDYKSDGKLHFQAGYNYGLIQVRRDYDFTP